MTDSIDVSDSGAQHSQGPGIPITRVAPRSSGNAKRHFGLPKFGNPLAGLSGKLPENWWIGLVLILVLVGGYVYFQVFGMPNFSAGMGDKALTFPGMPGVHIAATLATLALIGGGILGLIEAQSREDPFLLDWWIPYVVVGLLVYGQLFGTLVGWWWFFTGFAVCGLLAATVWNPSDQEDVELLDRIDTTAVFNTCFILIILFLAKWAVLPYPAFIPIVLVMIVGALAIFKELLRTPKFALLVIAMGIAAAVFYNPLWVFGTLTTAVVMAAVGAHQGWIPGASQKRTEVPVPPIMGRKLKLILAWDVVLCWFAVFIITAIIIYNNPVILTIGG